MTISNVIQFFKRIINFESFAADRFNNVFHYAIKAINVTDTGAVKFDGEKYVTILLAN